MTPQGVFRGTRKDFLNYIGIPVNKKNLSMLDIVLNDLYKKEFIMFDIDEDYIIIYVKRKAEREMWIGVDMLTRCRDIAKKYRKGGDKIIQLVKVWLAIQICVENQPFTYNDIMKLTGLSYYQIKDVKKMLEEDEIFRTSRAGSYYKCLGMEADLNGFFN